MELNKPDDTKQFKFNLNECDECGGPFDDDKGTSFSNGWMCPDCCFYRSKKRPRLRGEHYEQGRPS